MDIKAEIEKLTASLKKDPDTIERIVGQFARP